jgi:Fe-S-cluster-containing dehydrogenase component
MVLNLDRCIGCHTCVVACKMLYGTRPGVNYNGVVPVEWGEYPNGRQRYQLPMCMHCENAPCVAVCPVQATYTSAEGAVLMDYDKCIGCGACVTACPYDARTLVTDDLTYYPGVVMPQEEESSDRLNVVEKCTFCYGRVQDGGQPMCTIHCPGYSRIFGDVDDPESEISKYIAEKNAIHVEGTSIWYVAPADMPAEFLPKSLLDAAKAKLEG